jgi:hypothetical protein
MTERKIDIFFYGLFMDMALLNQRGVNPIDPRLACLEGFRIEIQDRATLIPDFAERVYGIVAGLTHEEIRTLYAEPSLQDYHSEAVLVTVGEDHLPALCFNLTQVTSSPRNTAYAAKLFELARKLSFPEAYLDKLQKLTQ